MQDNLKEITTYLMDESRSKATLIKQDANQKATEIVNAMVEKAKKEQGNVIKAYNKKAAEISEIANLKNNMDKHRILLSTKQELVDQTIHLVRERFENQSVHEWIKCMQMLIEEGKKETEELPTILVPIDYFEETKKAFDGEYNVEVRKIQSGFILSYSKFDLNYEVEHFFNYQKEELEVAAFELLFSSET